MTLWWAMALSSLASSPSALRTMVTTSAYRQYPPAEAEERYYVILDKTPMPA
jgi:hypothetical protein